MFNWLSKVFSPQKAPIGILQIADYLLSESTSHSTEHTKWIVSVIRKRWSEEGVKELKDHLLQIEMECLHSAEPVCVLRSAIMDAVDTTTRNSVLLEFSEEQLAAISNKSDNFKKEHVFGIYLFTEFETMCLRHYAIAKYQDGGRNDWFGLYVDGAKEFGKHMAHIIAANAGVYDGDTMFLASMHEPFSQAHTELRRKLLATPVGAVFPAQDA